ncbi:MAG: hypothetical protein KGL39_06440 [Patescibacteria group bacterium]|nr:hypothetical protein [Patescibacteria group bacterium]
MAINLASERDLLLPGLNALTGKYPQLPRTHTKIFEQRKATYVLERTVSMRYLSQAQLKPEGTPTTFDNNPGERYVYNHQMNTLSLGFAITLEAIEDNQYKKDFGPSVLGLQDAFLRAEEVYAANVLNTATTYSAAIGGDGKALGATDHPVDGNSIANLASPAVSLGEAALLNGQIAINANWRDNANQRMNSKPRRLVIPPQLEPTAIRLLKTELRPGTANNDVNAILTTQGGLPDGYLVWNYLTSAFSWFILSDCKGLLFWNRMPYQSDMSVEFSTDNLLVKGRQRYVADYDDWRCLYMSNPTS